MSDIATVLLSGRQVKPCNYRKTDKSAQCRFSIAVSHPKKDTNGNWIDDTDFFNCVAFGYQADYVNNKGGQGCDMSITGTLRLDKYTDKNGAKREGVQIIVESVHIATYRKAINNQQQPQQQQQPKNQNQQPPLPSCYYTDDDNMDIPF